MITTLNLSLVLNVICHIHLLLNLFLVFLGLLIKLLFHPGLILLMLSDQFL